MGDDPRDHGLRMEPWLQEEIPAPEGGTTTTYWVRLSCDTCHESLMVEGSLSLNDLNRIERWHQNDIAFLNEVTDWCDGRLQFRDGVADRLRREVAVALAVARAEWGARMREVAS